MSKSKALVILPPETKPAQLESYVVNFARLEEVHHRLGLAFQALQGYCLTQLRREHGFEKGGRPKISESFGGFQSWAAYVKQKFGFTDDMAARHMKTWEGMQPKIAKLPPEDQRAFLGLLSKPFSSFSPVHLQRLRDLTHKITDAASQTAFLRECGYIRQDHGKSIKDSRDRSQDADAVPAMDVPIAQQIDEQLELFAKSFLDLEKKVKIGKDDVLLISQWPVKKLDEAIAIKKRELQLLVKTRQAVKP